MEKSLMEFLFSWQSMSTMLASIMVMQTAITNFRQFLPPGFERCVRDFLSKVIQTAINYFLYLLPSKFQRFVRDLLLSFTCESRGTIVIKEDDNSYSNDLYDAAHSYLTSQCLFSPKVFNFSKHKNSRKIIKKMGSNQSFEVTFEGVKVQWSLQQSSNDQSSSDIGRNNSIHHSLELSFDEQHVQKIHDSYIPHIVEVYESIRFKNRQRRLYTNRLGSPGGWRPMPFVHPSTFETLAMDKVMKTEIQEDLKRFIGRKDYYTKAGRAWKRGYLLHGPPGTGKTSMIAAIANFLDFDIYDLELTGVYSNSSLMNLLINTSSKSVIVVEDIDCSLDLSNRKKKKKKKKKVEPGRKRSSSGVSLSGVLNFVDGLWSCCAGERLIIFTTNHKEKLDPALLRAGRMDKHIQLSYCGIDGFKILTKNYLGIEEHEVIKKVEKVLPFVKITPADIAEIFMSSDGNAEIALVNVVEEMERRLKKVGDSEVVAEAFIDPTWENFKARYASQATRKLHQLQVIFRARRLLGFGLRRSCQNTVATSIGTSAGYGKFRGRIRGSKLKAYGIVDFDMQDEFDDFKGVTKVIRASPGSRPI
ncbi:hypothetical protein GIB67_034710 [Kingdonia uniflora]|uniref:AAA+ ATPase domain-containing protein n=1 Tax=Kingdonia uniflora TaxID=39325 RepID=A0A7J7ML12_9MAGN|nr:hypothetical protein GIB67_034710 [Kingdonia uniflora]